MMKRYTTSALLLSTLLLSLSGCNKLTKANYDKIQSGMTYDEVAALIGKPTNCSEAIGITNCEWKNGDSIVTVNFIADKVALTTGENLK